jgi:hypothetical protein
MTAVPCGRPETSAPGSTEHRNPNKNFYPFFYSSNLCRVTGSWISPFRCFPCGFKVWRGGSGSRQPTGELNRPAIPYEKIESKIGTTVNLLKLNNYKVRLKCIVENIADRL